MSIAPQRPMILYLLAAGVLLRVILMIIAGNRLQTPWRVGGDAIYYAALASNVAGGMGYTYAHQPTAFRPPLYPLFLAAMMKTFGNSYARAVRLMQMAAGLVTVGICAGLAARLFGSGTAIAAALLALYFPTLSVFPTELITECFATLLSAAFFWWLFDHAQLLKLRTAFFLGLVIGLATLLRFNMALLGLPAVWMIGRAAGIRRALPNIALLTAVSAAVVSPWIIRNELVFHGQVLLSTQGGYNALQGVLTPQGRVQPGDLETLRRAGSWLSGDLETNDPTRLNLPSEPQLDQRAWQLARQAWGRKGWRLVPLAVEKLGYFWLSTDQLFSTHSFPLKLRVARAAGVLFYIALLGLSGVGWVALLHQRAAAAKFILGYGVLVSLAHLPFIMTSRHRIPFAEPLLVVLGGAGLTRLGQSLRTQGSGLGAAEVAAPASS